MIPQLRFQQVIYLNLIGVFNFNFNFITISLQNLPNQAKQSKALNNESIFLCIYLFTVYVCTSNM